MEEPWQEDVLVDPKKHCKGHFAWDEEDGYAA